MVEQPLRLGACDVDESAQLCPGAVIGKPFRPLVGGGAEDSSLPTVIGAGAYVGYYATVGSGSALAPKVIVDDYCCIESEVEIGDQSLVIYRAQICNEAVIGKGCVIGGFVAERTRIGDHARVFGCIVHSQHNPTLGWDEPDAMEQSARIEAGAFVGFNSTIVGNVTIGERAYVCSGSVVTKDVLAGHIVRGVNEMIPIRQWPGPLARSPHFR